MNFVWDILGLMALGKILEKSVAGEIYLWLLSELTVGSAGNKNVGMGGNYECKGFRGIWNKIAFIWINSNL